MYPVMKGTFYLRGSFFVIIILLQALSLQGQNYFYKLTEDDGLSDNRVTCFLKDRTGFLWIGTKNGLNRYDGNGFKIFRPSKSNSISNEMINDIVQDSTGKIWVATANGLNCYDDASGKWQNILPTNSSVKDDLPSYLLWNLETDVHNKLWIVSDVWELSYLNTVSKKYTYFNWPAVKTQSPFNKIQGYKSIQKIIRKNEQECWLGTTIGLFSVNTLTGKFSFYGSGYSTSVVDLKYDLQKKQVYLVTENGQIFCYREPEKKYTEIKPVLQTIPAKQWKKNNHYKKDLYLAHPQGMLQINTHSNEAILITNQPTLSASLLPGAVNSVYTDKDSIMWIGTNNGINYHYLKNTVADFIPLTILSGKENTDGMGATLYDTTEKKYFISSISTKEVFVIDEITGAISSIKQIGGKALTACTNICKDLQDNIWLLTETNVYQYIRSKKQFELLKTPNINEAVIFNDLLQDKKGDYWMATWKDGLYRYSPNQKKYFFYSSKDSFSARSITALMNDPKEEAIWIGSFNYGIYRFDLNKNIFINYTETPANPEYSQLVLIRDLKMGDAGKFWAATYGAGLYMYQPGLSYEKNFKQLSAKNGLPQNTFYAIASDNQKRIWLLDAKGLSVADKDGNFLFSAPRHPAMNFSNYATNLIYPKRIFFNSGHNELLVPVAGGLLLYNTEKKIPTPKFPIVVTDIMVNNQSVIHDSAYNRNEKISLSPKQNNLTFQYSALLFSNRNHLQYEYKLSNSDAEWKPAGTGNSIHFPNLSPGAYNFLLRAKDGEGNFSSNILSIPFYISPPFWKSTWFIALLAMLAIMLLFLWIKSLRRKIKTQKMLQYFATSLYGQNTVEDIFWDIAANCIRRLQFTDCVVYYCDHSRKLLLQKAAYGNKNPQKKQILNAIEIPFGKGITGAVALSGKGIIVSDTSKDSRYIVDEEKRYSEIAVPIMIDGKVFGVIDAEHPYKNFFNKHHLWVLTEIARLCEAKISRMVVEENLRTKISRDLHDEVGSALSTINVLSKVALSKTGNNEEIENYLQKINESTYSSMENMSDIVWAINPRNDKLDALLSRFNEFATTLCEAKEIELSFTSSEEAENISLDLTKRKNIYLIVKEALNNAVKYSTCKKISIQFELTDNIIYLSITDDGKGFNIHQQKNGNGLYNMKDRALECEGNLSIDSSTKGTKVIFQMPIPIIGVQAGKQSN